MVMFGYAFVVADLFHVGHLQFLEAAKKHCDHLIVGILTEKAVESYKRTPIIPLLERMRIVGALKCVDRVIIQPSLDPTDNLKQLIRDGVNVKLLFHGDDWDEIPGVDFIESVGGRLVKIYYYAGPTKVLYRGTAKIIEAIRMLPP